MRLHKTGHQIADTVSDLIGDLPYGDYEAAYGILRHTRFSKSRHWFEIDKGFWGAAHWDGNYRISYKGTQPKYFANGPRKAHGLNLKPWRNQSGPALICPPTEHVCGFFKIDYASWLMNAVRQANGPYEIRTKGTDAPVNWDSISKVIAFNSTIGVQALIEGIPVISDPEHSTIGSYLATIDNKLDMINRDELFSLMSAHQFRLQDKQAIVELIEFYLSRDIDGYIHRL